MNLHNVRMYSELSVNNAAFTLFINKMLQKRKKLTLKRDTIYFMKDILSKFSTQVIKMRKIKNECICI